MLAFLKPASRPLASAVRPRLRCAIPQALRIHPLTPRAFAPAVRGTAIALEVVACDGPARAPRERRGPRRMKRGEGGPARPKRVRPLCLPAAHPRKLEWKRRSNAEAHRGRGSRRGLRPHPHLRPRRRGLAQMLETRGYEVMLDQDVAASRHEFPGVPNLISSM